MAKQMTIDPTALISAQAKIASGVNIWAFAQVRERVVIGEGTVVGNGAYIDKGVRIGKRVNIHNKALLYRDLIVEDDVFIGPAVCFINDPRPRANVIRNLKGLMRRVKIGASIGANASIAADIHIGCYSMVGAGAVVLESVPDYALVAGVPARVKGFVSPRGVKLVCSDKDFSKTITLREPGGKFKLTLPRKKYEQYFQ